MKKILTGLALLTLAGCARTFQAPVTGQISTGKFSKGL